MLKRVRLLTRNPIRPHVSQRFMSSHQSHNTLSYVPHAFSFEDAVRRFKDANDKRWFAPFNNGPSSTALTLFDSQPLKKVLAPFFRVDAEIGTTHYKGKFGIKHISISTDHKGRITTNTYTTWHSISGTLPPHHFKPHDSNMSIYAGYRWPHSLMEDALERYILMPHATKPFDPYKMDEDIEIDPYLKRLATGQEGANDRIMDTQRRRIEEDIRRRISCDSTNSGRFEFEFTKFKLECLMLPAYILQYPNATPLILPAISSDDHHVYGSGPVSVTKTSVVTAVAATVATLFFPQFAIPLRMGATVGVTLASALMAKYGNVVRHKVQQRKLAKQRDKNEDVAATLADKKRLEATLLELGLNVNPAYYTILGLDKNAEIDPKAVHQAFNKAILNAHPDHGGSVDKSRKVIEARNAFNNAFARQKRRKDTGARQFSTYAGATQIKQPPRSVFDPNTSRLMEMVLDKKDYKGALTLVESGTVHPDGHNHNENTVLTEAARRGDLKAIAFIIDQLGASVDTSCDCPCHNTALHYAAGTGNNAAINSLVKRGATVNLINSKGQTARDIAKENGNSAADKLLEQHGGLLHRNGEHAMLVQARATLFGYSSTDRTLLVKAETPNKALS